MQYYYSLLESYQQLKQRKFKLSLREDDGSDAIKAAVPEVQAAAQAAFAGDENYKEEGLGNGGNITIEREGSDKSGNPKIRFSGSNLGWGLSFTQAKFGNLNWSHKGGNGYKIASAWVGAGEEEGEEGEAGDEQAEQDMLLAQKITDEGNKARDTIKELLGVDGTFPGLIIDTKHTRRPESLANVARGETQGFAGQVEDMEERVLNSNLIEPEQKLASIQVLNASLKALKNLHEKGWSNPETILGDEGMQEFEADEIGDVLSKMKVTPHGILLDGVAIFYRGDSTPETDALRNLAEQLNDAAKVYNSQWENATELQDDPKIPELKMETQAPRTGGADESYRGPVAEKFMRCSAAILRGQRDWNNATTSGEKKKVMGKMRKELSERYQEAVKDGSLDKMVEVFGVGGSVALGEIIANREHMNDAMFVATCQKVLESRGMAPNKAAEMIKQAGGSPPERGVMMALLTTTMVNQNMDQQLFGDDPDLIPDNIIHEGDTDSASSGKKADVVFEWNDESKCKKIAAHYAKKLGGTATDSGCGENSGIKNMMSPREGGGCRMEVELKTLSNASSKGGAGELSRSRSTALCNDAPVVDGYDEQVLKGALQASEGMSQATKDFSAGNLKRLDGCGGEGTAKRGCEAHKKIQTQVERYTKLLTPGSPGVTPARSQALLDNWWSMKKQDDKGKARFDAATRVVNGSKNKEDLKAMKKVKDDLQQQVFKREIHRTSEGAGTGTGEITDDSMRDYLLMNYSQACASTQETLRVTRRLDSGAQTVYLNNATVEANIKRVKDGTAKFEFKKGGTIINLVDNDGNVLAKNDTGRGISKWTVGKSTSALLKEEQESNADSLLLTFLLGQQELIAELIGRTT